MLRRGPISYRAAANPSTYCDLQFCLVQEFLWNSLRFAFKWLTQLLNRQAIQFPTMMSHVINKVLLSVKLLMCQITFPDFTPFSADNVDLYICTLDGLDTLHATCVSNSISTPKHVAEEHLKIFLKCMQLHM
jgi:hypothetical protein